MDWLDLLAVRGTLKSVLQHHSSKASILLHSAFFIVQLSHPYMTTGKTIALTRRTFVGKVMSLLFNMLSRLVITFLSNSKHLLNVTKCTFPLFPWVSSHPVLDFHFISLPIDDLHSSWSTGMVRVMDVYTWYLATKPHDPAIPFLGIYLEKNMVWKDTCIPVFIAALCSTVYNSQNKEAI